MNPKDENVIKLAAKLISDFKLQESEIIDNLKMIYKLGTYEGYSEACRDFREAKIAV